MGFVSLSGPLGRKLDAQFRGQIAPKRSAAEAAMEAHLAETRARIDRAFKAAAWPVAEQRRPLGRTILEQVARKYELTIEDLRSPDRHKAVVYPRQEAMYALAQWTDLSYPQIGHLLRRDHTTVINGIAHHAARNGLPIPRRPEGWSVKAVKPVSTKRPTSGIAGITGAQVVPPLQSQKEA